MQRVPLFPSKKCSVHPRAGQCDTSCHVVLQFPMKICIFFLLITKISPSLPVLAGKEETTDGFLLLNYCHNISQLKILYLKYFSLQIFVQWSPAVSINRIKILTASQPANIALLSSYWWCREKLSVFIVKLLRFRLVEIFNNFYHSTSLTSSARQEGASDVSKYWWGRERPLTITVARDVFMERLERRNNNIEFHCGTASSYVLWCSSNIVSDFI